MLRERSSITSARFGGVGGLSQNADTADALEGGWGGLSQNADMLTLGRERVGEFKHRASICGQILEVINKVMNFFLNHALISLNTPQNIFLTIIKKANFDNLKHIVKVNKHVTFCSSITSAN